MTRDQSLPRHTCTNSSFTSGLVKITRVNKLVASSDGTKSTAELVSAPEETVSDIFEIVTGPEAAESLSTSGAEPVQSVLQS